MTIWPCYFLLGIIVSSIALFFRNHFGKKSWTCRANWTRFTHIIVRLFLICRNERGRVDVWKNDIVWLTSCHLTCISLLTWINSFFCHLHIDFWKWAYLWMFTALVQEFVSFNNFLSRFTIVVYSREKIKDRWTAWNYLSFLLYEPWFGCFCFVVHRLE